MPTPSRRADMRQSINAPPIRECPISALLGRVQQQSARPADRCCGCGTRRSPPGLAFGAVKPHLLPLGRRWRVGVGPLYGKPVFLPRSWGTPRTPVVQGFRCRILRVLKRFASDHTLTAVDILAVINGVFPDISFGVGTLNLPG